MKRPRESVGGPAFPTCPVRDDKGKTDPDFYHGMSLRDYFAGQALVGMADRDETWHETAVSAYAAADAMLSAREKEMYS